MSLESILVRMLNRPRQAQPERVTGFGLVVRRVSSAAQMKNYSLPWRPVQPHVHLGPYGKLARQPFWLRAMEEHCTSRVPFLFIDFQRTCHGVLARAASSGERGTGRSSSSKPWSDPVVGWNPLEPRGESPYGLVQELIGIFPLASLARCSWGPLLEELLRMTLLVPPPKQGSPCWRRTRSGLAARVPPHRPRKSVPARGARILGR